MNTPHTTLQRVTSKDGTSIAFDRLGDGPPIILVCGGSVDRMSNAGLAAVLATDFTVFNYDRRGRGDSSDTLPYAVEREVEDIDAVVAAAGGSAYLYGTSSGAALALEAARRLGSKKITKLALWEPPFIMDENARPPADQVAQYDAMIAEGRRGDAVEYFTAKVVGLPPEFVAFAKTQPFWAAQEKIAHTLAYDATVMGDYSVPLEEAAEVTVPTIVLTGSASFPFFAASAAAIADAMPDARADVLQDQEHNVDPTVIGPALKTFFAG
jgi:pimeloyl-ACP methyl ester carboxylesterase